MKPVMALPANNPVGQAIVLANGLNGYGAVRSLARAGIESIVVVPSADDLAAWSRLPKAVHVIPIDDQWERKVAELLSSIAGPQRVPIVACSDRAAKFLEDQHPNLEARYAVAIPDGRIIEMLNDKRMELEFMQSLGIPLPPSITRVRDQSGQITHDGLGFPLVVKPRSFDDYSLINAKNIVLNSAEERQRFLEAYAGALDRFVIQRVIEGDDTNLWVCNATIGKDHRLVRWFCFRRLGTAPSHFGVTSLARSESNPVIVALVERIALATRYFGPIMVEFKFEPRTGQYLYIETNPRLGMCNWFDTACGVNNVEASCAVALGIQLPAAAPQQDGKLFVHALADLVARLEDRESIGSILGRYWRLRASPRVWAVYDPLDPRPFLGAAVSALGNLGQRVLRAGYRRLSGAKPNP